MHLCTFLDVSRSGFYKWRKRVSEETNSASDELVDKIRAIHKKSKYSYGSPRVCKALRREGIICNHKRVAKLMQTHDIRSKKPRKWITTTDSNHTHSWCDNVLNRDFTASKVNEKWTTDITYLPTSAGGWVYLAVVLDLYSRKIIGWSIAETMETSLCLDAFYDALKARENIKGVLHHSDRGVQYCSDEYQRKLSLFSIVCSMSRKGNCWDNSPTESFFATLKWEMDIQEFDSVYDAQLHVGEYIRYYNYERIHSSIGYVTPHEFEHKLSKTYESPPDNPLQERGEILQGNL